MCVCPRTIERRLAGKVSLYVVPCGVCHECISKKQNEFAALACLEAKRRFSMWFFTFTYSNSTCPVMWTVRNEYDELFSSFVDSEHRPEVLELLSLNMDGSKKLNSREEMGIVYCPSLRREDVRLFLKRVRQSYFREFNKSLSFVYAGFGEYGDSTFRPHYHFLIYDLTPDQAYYIERAWRADFGFAQALPIPILNEDGSPAHVKVSKYVAKYLGKPKSDFQPLLDGFCEAPRRLSSRRFGCGIIEDKLKPFYLCEDLSHRSKEERFIEILERKKSLIIDGAKFPLPRRISESFFRCEVPPDFKVKVNEKTGEITEQVVRKTVRSPLSIQVSSFARNRYLQDFDRKLRACAARFPDAPFSKAICEVLEDEKSALSDRIKLARKIYLQHLKNEKYG